jgi:transposase-like protein
MAHVDTDTARRLRRAAGHLERWHTERDELIRQAHAEGMGVREIARQVGMTHPGVLAILARERGAERGLVSMGVTPPASSSQLSGAPVDYDG